MRMERARRPPISRHAAALSSSLYPRMGLTRSLVRKAWVLDVRVNCVSPAMCAPYRRAPVQLRGRVRDEGESPPARGTKLGGAALFSTAKWRTIMGRGILLWLLGVPIPIIILLALIWHQGACDGS